MSSQAKLDVIHLQRILDDVQRNRGATTCSLAEVYTLCLVTLVFLIVVDIVVQLGGKLVRHGEQSVSAAWETEV
jgi:hypothetical protein